MIRVMKNTEEGDDPGAEEEEEEDAQGEEEEEKVKEVEVEENNRKNKCADLDAAQKPHGKLLRLRVQITH